MEFWRHRRRSAADIERDRVVAAERDPRLGPAAGPPDHRDAFVEGIRQGRREERSRHRGHPVLGLLLVLVAVAGALMLAVAAREGSFSRGGQVIDRHLSAAGDQAEAAGAQAVARTGEAIKNAGETIEQKASEPAARP